MSLYLKMSVKYTIRDTQRETAGLPRVDDIKEPGGDQEKETFLRQLGKEFGVLGGGSRADINH